jgi:hypothetical protein
MEFDFLPDNTPPPKPSTEESGGGKFSVGENYFFDDYKHHLNAHLLFSTPPLESEFILKHNFKEASYYFAERTLEGGVRNGKYGDNTTLQNLIEGYTQFQKPELLNETLGKINSEIKTEMFSELEKPKMNINDRFGIFSFDLASMAMSYVYEYFSATDGRKLDSNYIIKKGSKFYKIGSKIEVVQKIKRRENGTPVVVSSVKNVFIDFDKKNTQERSVEIIVSNSFMSSEKPKDIIYNSMAAIAVAQNLLLKGFKVKVTSLIAARNSENQKNYFHLVPVKRFNQPLDINAAAYVCGDPRFFRYQGFKMMIKGYDVHKHKTPSGIASILNNNRLISEIIEKDYVKNSDLKQADTRLFFGGSRNLEAAKKEVQQAIEILNNKYSNHEQN